MNYDELTLGTNCDLSVVRNQYSNSNSNYFVVSTDDGHRFTVPKLQFQKTQDAPGSINCIVYDFKNGTPLIRQNLAYVISSYYEKGKVYDFTVKSPSPGNVTSFTLTDDKGFVFKLNNAPKSLLPGKKIKCRV